jgi:hypothetical protein
MFCAWPRRMWRLPSASTRMPAACHSPTALLSPSRLGTTTANRTKHFPPPKTRPNFGSQVRWPDEGRRAAHRCRNPTPFAASGQRCSMKAFSPIRLRRVPRRGSHLSAWPSDYSLLFASSTTFFILLFRRNELLHALVSRGAPWRSAVADLLAAPSHHSISIGPASAANRAATFKRLSRTRAEHRACLHVFAKTRARLSTSVHQELPGCRRREALGEGGPELKFRRPDHSLLSLKGVNGRGSGCGALALRGKRKTVGFVMWSGCRMLQNVCQSMQACRVCRTLRRSGALLQRRCHAFQLRQFALAHVRALSALDRLLQRCNLVRR